MILFGAFTVAAFARLFSVIDSRFYEPAKLSQINQNLNSISSTYDEYMHTLKMRFALGSDSFLKNKAVSSFVESRPSDKDVEERGELLGDLRSSTQGLIGLRILDKNLNSVHYSTFRNDVLRRDIGANLTAYKDYSECLNLSGNKEISASELFAGNSGDMEKDSKTLFDSDGRIIFSFPLYDKYSVFRASAVFYVNAFDFNNILLKKNLISIGASGQFLCVNSGSQTAVRGFAFGIPSVADDKFYKAIEDVWQRGETGVTRLFSADSSYFVLVSGRTQDGTYISQVFNDEIFALPASGRALILTCIFISLFLITFFILNLRRDDMTVIRERIRTLQLGVVDEYLSKKESLDWEKISGRREAVTKEIISSLGRRAKKHPREVEELINRSWDELFAAMNLKPHGQAATEALSAQNTEEIKRLLQELLSNGGIKVQPSVSVPSAPVHSPSKTAEEMEEVPDAEAAEDLEEAEPLEEVPDAEAAENLEEAEPLEEVPDAGAAENLEEAEPLEEVPDAGAAENLEVAEPKETFDISENIENDFFAVKKNSEEKETSLRNEAEHKHSLLQRAEKLRDDDGLLQIDSFSKIRNPVSHDNDTESVVSNFSIQVPDYKDLDAHTEEQKVNGTIETEKKNFTQELSPEDFGIEKNTDDGADFSEEICFSAPEIQIEDADTDVAATFTTEIPRFSNENTDSSKKNEVLSDAPSEAVPVNDTDSFMFSAFGGVKNASAIQSAEQKSIVQGNDGVYSIPKEIDTDTVDQDNIFRKLVDSVLYNC